MKNPVPWGQNHYVSSDTVCVYCNSGKMWWIYLCQDLLYSISLRKIITIVEHVFLASSLFSHSCKADQLFWLIPGKIFLHKKKSTSHSLLLCLNLRHFMSVTENNIAFLLISVYLDLSKGREALQRDLQLVWGKPACMERLRNETLESSEKGPGPG